MKSKGLLVITAIVAVVALGGIGFAQFTSSAYVKGTATAGTIGTLNWASPPPSPTCPSDVLTVGAPSVSPSGTTLLLGAYSYFAPGDSCSLSEESITETGGSLPGTLTWTDQSSSSPAGTLSCWSYSVAFSPATIPAGGGSSSTTITFGLATGAGDSCENAVLTLSLTVVLSAGT